MFEFTLQVFSPGESVIILDGLQGIVTAVMIESAAHVSYKVAWLNGSTYEEKWISAVGVKADGRTKLTLGFGSTRE